ncbi:MAG TPA: zinc ribbon domain-containing protein [Chthoniobacterales bacterium]|nr:zinc ribbon domain-containing protein [Chthoniobacterales bacterium]
MMTKLVCPECGHDNEPERVYCHSCGARLDRSGVAVGKSREEAFHETRRRVRSMFDPTGVKIRFWFFRTAKLILAACAAAAVIEMISPPDVPPPVKSSLLLSQIGLELENAATYHRPPQLQYSEDQVNAHLAYALRNKQSTLDKPLLEFKRAIVGVEEGRLKLTTERSLLGLSLYSSVSYLVTLRQGHITATSNGGGIGRVPIHPQLMRFVDGIFGDVWTALDRERKLVAKMGSIELHSKRVVLNVAAPAAVQ